MSVLSRWKARLRVRRNLLRAARRRHEANPTPESRRVIDDRKEQVAYAERVVERHDRDDRPRIVNLDLKPREGSQLSPQGTLRAVTGHYTAGPVDQTDEQCEALLRGYDRAHKAKGWTMLGYAFAISRAGTIYLGRPATAIGAHVLNQNSGNVGIVCNGTTGDRPTAAQARSLRWLLANAHTDALPKAWRVDLRGLPVKGHNDWMATACPGSFKRMYTSKGTKR
ncbi:peptidoglycan recognition protein family protein [Paraconexibacter algicola]|uniref:N-acetylmuramoyl-L-alanine amidase n=1 Tax=Paraconexibacter algicola TaxID=2133960 RepID=A0A2T4UE34_9ACTN|nr:peptidoglycan recognition family protein [Paraconexibacter algicola]PTL55760.1 hypothetical protein C7Y72_19215 [Paraconexibacter algicola]